MFGLIVLLTLIVLIVFGIRQIAQRRGGAGWVAGGTSGVHAVRQIFQYAVLYGLLVIAASGLSGLLGRLLHRGTLIQADSSALARSLAFTVVGVPLYAAMAWWTHRSFHGDRLRDDGTADDGTAQDSPQARSVAWACYGTAACLTGLGYAMASLYSVLAWATRLYGYDAAALASLLVWGGVWGVHWWLERRLTPIENAQPHHLIGSLAGLGTATAGVAVLVAGTIEAMTGIGRSTELVAGVSGQASVADTPLLRAAILLVVGVPVWLLYWWRTASHSARNPAWLCFVLLAGVAGGLVTAVVGASVAGYEVLVWLFGQPWSSDAAVHFRSLPPALGAAVAGVLLWWYHHKVLAQQSPRERTEVQRVYEYLMAGTGLVAAAVGLTMVIVALVDAVTGSVALLGSAAANLLIAALTVMAVGAPVWVVFWRRIQSAARSDPLTEPASITRRLYLLVVFGLSGVAAVVSLLVAVYLFAQDKLASTLGAATLRSMRVPIGVLVSTAVVSGYHAFVYRADRAGAAAHAQAPAAQPHGPRYVLLVGPQDSQVAHAVAHETGGRVQTWRTDDGVPWTADGVLAALATLGPAPVEEALVVNEPDGVHAFAVHRH